MLISSRVELKINNVGFNQILASTKFWVQQQFPTLITTSTLTINNINIGNIMSTYLNTNDNLLEYEHSKLHLQQQSCVYCHPVQNLKYVFHESFHTQNSFHLQVFKWDSICGFAFNSQPESFCESIFSKSNMILNLEFCTFVSLYM